MENQNPVIISDAELPTRRENTQRSKGGKSVPSFDIYAPGKPTGPFSIYMSDSDPSVSDDDDDAVYEPIDEQEIFDLISTISDPEHPYSLGSLSVVSLPDIHISPPPTTTTQQPTDLVTVLVEITPTITHCSLATVIGLAVRVRLEKSLPPNFRVDVRIKPGTHSQDEQVNKQLADKERVAAATENATLMGVLKKMMETCK